MPRLNDEFLGRIERFSDRVLDVVESAEKSCPAFARDQMGRAGSGVGANLFEASYALSRKDFVKSAGTSLKELGETKFWLRRYARRQWVKPTRLDPLLAECDELLKILSVMLRRAEARGDRRT